MKSVTTEFKSGGLHEKHVTRKPGLTKLGLFQEP